MLILTRHLTLHLLMLANTIITEIHDLTCFQVVFFFFQAEDGIRDADGLEFRRVLFRSALLESSLHGEANVLICPNLDAANILFNVLKTTGGHGTTIGPILLGGAAAAHVLTPSATVRRDRKSVV